jgi:mannose-6-phosphate isomerase
MNQDNDGQRPWGYFEILSDDMVDHKVKRITVWPGKRLSLQWHQKRREHWIVIAGTALVTLDGMEIQLSASNSIDIPHKSHHRVENIGTVPLVLIEVQQGEYFGEDDIVRVEDDFGRS